MKTCRSCLKSKNDGAFDVIPDKGRPTCRLCAAKLDRFTKPLQLNPKSRPLTVEELERGRVKKNMRESEESRARLLKFVKDK